MKLNRMDQHAECHWLIAIFVEIVSLHSLVVSPDTASDLRLARPRGFCSSSAYRPDKSNEADKPNDSRARIGSSPNR